jgi:DNA-directed RNA polymerase specialized sigma subunit
MSFPCPIQPPADGFDKMEQVFLRQTIIRMYRVVKSSRDKFILIAIHEMGYPQEAVAEMLGISQVTICNRLQKIRQFLKLQPLMEGLIPKNTV